MTLRQENRIVSTVLMSTFCLLLHGETRPLFVVMDFMFFCVFAVFAWKNYPTEPRG